MTEMAEMAEKGFLVATVYNRKYYHLMLTLLILILIIIILAT